MTNQFDQEIQYIFKKYEEDVKEILYDVIQDEEMQSIIFGKVKQQFLSTPSNLEVETLKGFYNFLAKKLPKNEYEAKKSMLGKILEEEYDYENQLIEVKAFGNVLYSKNERKDSIRRSVLQFLEHKKWGYMMVDVDGMFPLTVDHLFYHIDSLGEGLKPFIKGLKDIKDQNLGKYLSGFVLGFLNELPTKEKNERIGRLIHNLEAEGDSFFNDTLINTLLYYFEKELQKTRTPTTVDNAIQSLEIKDPSSIVPGLIDKLVPDYVSKDQKEAFEALLYGDESKFIKEKNSQFVIIFKGNANQLGDIIYQLYINEKLRNKYRKDLIPWLVKYFIVKDGRRGFYKHIGKEYAKKILQVDNSPSDRIDLIDIFKKI